MHPFFEPLSEKESMLLLTTLTIGGSNDTQLFQYIPTDVAQRLQEKAQRLLEIPADKRIPFMVKEMKAALNTRGLPGIEMIDPSWLVQELKGESPRVVASLLVTLPQPTVRSILKRLPEGIRNSLPAKAEIRQAPKSVIKTLRQIFDSRFVAMPTKAPREFSFTALIHLKRKDLQTLLYSLGMSELGQAFVSIGRQALVDLCRRLPRDQAEALVVETKKASVYAQKAELRTAQRFLSRVAINFENTNEFFHKAGIWRLAKSSVNESAEFKLQMQQRLPRDPGLLLTEYIEIAGDMDDLEQDIIHRFQDSLLFKIQELSQRATIDAAWSEIPFHFHDPNFALTPDTTDESEPDPQNTDENEVEFGN